jgi:RHS repeat-associated protein
VWAAAHLDATYDTKGLHFHISDPLGSRRVQTSSATGLVEETCQSLPFGDVLDCYIPTSAPATADDATEHHFTGKERDTESGNDYFDARYFGSSMGRFMSPDPSGLFYADPTNPQSLNLYSYVLNNPLVNVDPTGLDCVYFNDDQSVNHVLQGDCASTQDNGYYIDATGVNNATLNDNGDLTSYSTGGGSFLADGTPNNSSVEVTAPDPGIDPDEARINALVQGVATDTAGFPTVCSVQAYGQINVGPLQGRYSYDSNSGGKFSGGGRVTPGAPDSINSPVTGKNTPLGAALPFSGSVRVNQNGSFSGSLGVRDPETGLGADVSVDDHGRPGAGVSWARGVIQAGARAIFGTMGDPRCH